MSDLAERILNLRRTVERMQRERDKLIGAEEQMKRQAQKEFGVSDLSTLKALQAKEEKLAAKKRTEAEAKEKEFMAKYGKLLEEDND